MALNVDGSGSMLGYVKDGDTNYVKVLKLLSEVFELNNGIRSQVNLEYYRIGATGQKLTRQDYRKAELPVFYDGTEPKFKPVSSPINNAIIAPADKEDKMTVIVTDLEQDDGDVTSLNKQIQNAYFNKDRKNYAIAIWAVKSEFNGKLFIQVQNNLKDFPYNSGKQPNKLRPFYVIFIGPYEDINYYLNQLKKQSPSELSENGHFLIFNSNKTVEKISKLETLPTVLPKGLSRPISLVKKGVVVNKENFPAEILQIDNQSKDSLTLNYSIPFSPSNYNLSIDPNSLETKFVIKRFDEFTKKFKEDNDNPQLIKAIDLTKWQIENENKLNFTANIQPDKFTQPGIYLLNVDVLSKKFQEPSWWNEWNSKTQTSEPDGTKTHNLLTFLQALKNRTEELKNSDNSHSIIGHLCYGIQKD